LLHVIESTYQQHRQDIDKMSKIVISSFQGVTQESVFLARNNKCEMRNRQFIILPEFFNIINYIYRRMKIVYETLFIHIFI